MAAMDDRYAELPVADLVRRWERLSEESRAGAYGYMSTAVNEARVAIEMAEKWAASEAEAVQAARRPKLRTITGGRRG